MKIDISAEPATPPEQGVKVHVRKGEEMDKKPFEVTSDGTWEGTHLTLDGQEVRGVTYLNFEVPVGKECSLTLEVDGHYIKTFIQADKAFLLLNNRRFELVPVEEI